MKTKTRLVAAVPFHKDLLKVLVTGTYPESISLGVLVSAPYSASFIASIVRVGEASTSAVQRVFEGNTGIKTDRDDWERFYIQEDANTVIHWYTSRSNIFNAMGTQLAVLVLDAERGWVVPEHMCSVVDSESIESSFSLAPDMEYLVPMARLAIKKRWPDK